MNVVACNVTIEDRKFCDDAWFALNDARPNTNAAKPGPTQTSSVRRAEMYVALVPVSIATKRSLAATP